MTEDNKAKALEGSIESEFAKLGGKKVGHFVPVKGEKEVDLSSVGGMLVERSPLWAETKPAE